MKKDVQYSGGYRVGYDAIEQGEPFDPCIALDLAMQVQDARESCEIYGADGSNGACLGRAIGRLDDYCAEYGMDAAPYSRAVETAAAEAGTTAGVDFTQLLAGFCG